MQNLNARLIQIMNPVLLCSNLVQVFKLTTHKLNFVRCSLLSFSYCCEGFVAITNNEGPINSFPLLRKLKEFVNALKAIPAILVKDRR